jgi:hypothetical protein
MCVLIQDLVARDHVRVFFVRGNICTYVSL